MIPKATQADKPTVPQDLPEEDQGRRSVKLTVNLPDAEMSTIRARAGQNHETVTQLLRRAIGTTLFLDEEVAQGGRVLVERRDRTLVEVVFPATHLAAQAAIARRQGRTQRAASKT